MIERSHNSCYICTLFYNGMIFVQIRCLILFVLYREDQSVWERRAPLGPQHVRKLVKQGVKVCTKVVFALNKFIILSILSPYM
jgi:hypothetical protein